MTRDDVASWLDRYVEAWRSNDPGAIRVLFATDAEYRYHPWDEPVTGADAIAADWLASPDAPGTWDAAYEPFAVDGDRAVARGTSDYDDADGKRRYHNVFLLEFDEAGDCRSFTELYLQQR